MALQVIFIKKVQQAESMLIGKTIPASQISKCNSLICQTCIGSYCWNQITG